MAPIPGVSLLHRVGFRVWEANHKFARCQIDHDLATIILRFLYRVEQWQVQVITEARTVGNQSSIEFPNLDMACREAFGITFSEFGDRSRARDEAREAELWRCIPDFDPMAGMKPREGRMYDES